MTSTEIIIRIKKARKKRKLVVPKKRVASYRTNRWFAKPRWVEIELTYTQASKLGLVEPRTPSKEVTSGISAEQQVAGHAIVESEHTLPGGSAPEAEPSGTSTWQRLFELDPNVDQPGQLIGTDDVDFVSDDDHLEDDTVLPRSLPHDGSRVPLLQTLPMADADACSRQSTSAVAAARPRTDRAAPRARAFLLVASSASVLASVAAAWITLSGFPTTPTTVDTACARSEPSASCTQVIVTGSIGKVDQPQWPEPSPAAAFATHASSEPISAIEQLQLSAPQIPKTATTPTEREDDSGKVANRVNNGNERTGPANAAAESDPLPAATTPKTSLLLPQNVSAAPRLPRVTRCRSIDQYSIRLCQLESETSDSACARGLCSEVAVLSVDQGDYRRPHGFRRACSLEPVAVGSSCQNGVRASCPCRRAAKSVVGDWIWAIPPLRTQRVDQEQAQQPTSCVGCRCPSLASDA